MIAKKIISKIDAILREKTSEEIITEGTQEIIDTLRMLRSYVEDAGERAATKTKKEKPVKQFLVHGKVFFYDLSTKSPVVEEKILTLEAANEDEAKKKFVTSMEATEKAQVGTQKVFSRVEVGRVTNME